MTRIPWRDDMHVPLPALGDRDPTEPEWMIAVDRLLANMTALRVHFQPVVDLRRGIVAGYETLATFATSPRRPPNEWFAAAARSGVAARLDAAIIQAALRARDALPSNCFLTLNLDPNNLSTRDVAAALSEVDDLRPLVIELTEHAAIDDYPRLTAQIRALRIRGAMVAVDDAGAGYASLSHVLRLRPEFVKIDRAFVDGCDQDPAKEALIEMLGQFAGRLDSWIIAEGIERPEELAVLCRLRVPLGQGYLLGRAADVWTGPPLDVARKVREQSAQVQASDTLAPLLEHATTRGTLGTTADGFHSPRPGFVVVLDDWSRPTGLILPQTRAPKPMPMRAALSSSPHEVLQRAMARPQDDRFDPIVCCHEDGVYAGIVRVELLIAHTTRTPPGLLAHTSP